MTKKLITAAVLLVGARSMKKQWPEIKRYVAMRRM